MRWLMTLVLCTATATGSAQAAQREWWRDGGPRLRPQDSRMAGLLEQGRLRSATLRALADRVEGGDVFVYLTGNHMMESHLAGSLTWMATSGSYRYVRVSIDAGLPVDQLIAMLGHELQHVAEVSDDPSVVDAASLATLYRRIGHASLQVTGSSWETIAAQLTARQVRRELGTVPTRSVAGLASPDGL